jgi:hypothetical protein
MCVGFYLSSFKNFSVATCGVWERSSQWKELSQEWELKCTLRTNFEVPVKSGLSDQQPRSPLCFLLSFSLGAVGVEAM